MANYIEADEIRKADGLTPETPAAVLDERQRRARALLAERGLDAILIWTGGVWKAYLIRYLVDYVNTFPIAEAFLLMPTDGDPLMLVDRPWFTDHAKRMTRIPDVRTFPYVEYDWQIGELSRLFGQLLAEKKLAGGRIAINVRDLPSTYYLALREGAPGARFEDVTELSNLLFETKADYDRRMIRKVAAIGDEAMMAAIATAREGIEEYKLTLAAWEVMFSYGAEFPNPDQHFYTGAGNTLLSNVRPYFSTARKLKCGEMFWMDMGTCYKGYYVDFCRTLCVGEPSPAQRRIFELTEKSHRIMLQSLKPGVTGSALWDTGHELAREQGYGDNINAVWLGHGTGFKTSEPPFLIKGEPRTVKPGTFVNIEPGILLPGVCNAAIEDMTFVTDEGAELVTRCGRELHVV